MPSTHTSLHYHVVFSTKDREPLIATAWRETLHEYMGGTVRGLGGVPLMIGGVFDHVHLLIGLKPMHCLADVIRETKKASTTWVKGMQRFAFHWQDGYGASTISRSHVAKTADYIRNQEEHHRTRSFQEEYVAFLEANGIEYDERYLW